MIEKVLSSVVMSYCFCSLVCGFVLLSGKVAADIIDYEQNQTILVYNIGDCSHQNASGEIQLNCGGANESFNDVSSKVKKEIYKHVQITVNTTRVHLNESVRFMNLTSLAITGTFHLPTIVCTAADAGMILENIDSVTLINLNLTGCGALYVNIFKKDKTFSSALVMINCSNVQIHQLIIVHSNGTGLMILNHHGGTVNVSSSIFRDNKLPPLAHDQGCIIDNESYLSNSTFGGGGVYILLGKFQPENSYSPMTFQFENCTFERNTARNKYFPGELWKDCGEGGGVYLTTDHKRGISNVYVSFVNCSFVENFACIGAGLSMKVHGGSFGQEIANITFNVTDSHFDKNGCDNNTDRHYNNIKKINGCSNGTNEHMQTYAKFGGGVYLAFTRLSNYGSVLSRSGIENCHYHFSNVNFTENCAKYGGGVYYYSDRSEQVPTNNTMSFDDCRFERNRAHIGSAVDLTPDIYFKKLTGYTIVPTFTNCAFLENCVFIYKDHSGQKTLGLGTIRTSLQDIKFEGHIAFKNNWGTALYSVNAIINFQKSSATFVSNTGLQGGAIALVESATMILGPHSYEFLRNRAFYQGGAIYVLLIDHFDIEVSQSCFIQYANPNCDHDLDHLSNYTCDEWPWRANITFDGNEVIRGNAGHTIFATSLHPCQVVNKDSRLHSEFVVNTSEVFTQRGIKLKISDDQVATDGAKIHVNSNTPLKILPGEEYSHNITITDDLEQNASVLFRVKKSDRYLTYLNSHQTESDDFEIGYPYIGKTLQVMGKPNNQTKYINLYTLSPRQNYVEIAVKLIDCPPGFKLDDKTNTSITKCICDENAAVGIYGCNSGKFHSHLLHGYWAGYLPEDLSHLVTCTCPFCNYTNISVTEFYISLPKNKSELERAVCGDTRKGTVCGECSENYTVHFHSPGYLCKPVMFDDNLVSECRLGWLFYILSELVPITLVFIVVLVFNISFTSGRVSGLILFSQLLGMFDIDASGIIKFTAKEKHTIDGWAQGYKIIYGVFNLEFFNSEALSFCIMKHASALDVIAFKYVTILYILILIASVIWIVNKCGGRCCGKYCRITTVKSSVIHGISSFLVICYTKCVQISMHLLNPVHFNVEVESKYSPHVRVWYNAEVEYFRKEHLKYAFPAIFCLLTIGILPPALLLSYPLLNKVTTFFGCDDLKVTGFISQKLSISKLKPLLDSFQSCFKDNMRFFAGLYFLYRMVILLIYAVTISFSAYYTAVSGAILIVLVLHTICQPYVNRVHNIIDALLFANLILISCFSFYNYHRTHYLRGVKHLTTTLATVLQLILIYLPLIVLGVYILVALCKKLAKCKPIASTERAIRLREFIRTISNENKDNDSDEVELTHDELMDEDVEYNANTCGYFKAGLNDTDSEMTLRYI